MSLSICPQSTAPAKEPSTTAVTPLSTAPALIIMFHPSVTVIPRDRTALQFGLDGTTAGIIEAQDTHLRNKIIAALSICHTPTPLGILTKRLAKTGIGSPSALQIVGDLLEHGIIHTVPHHPATVGLITPDFSSGQGSSTHNSHTVLLQAFRDIFTADGMRLRTQEAGYTLQTFAASFHPDEALIIIGDNSSTHTMMLSRALRTWTGTVIPVNFRDGRGVIGPVRQGGRGPCPTCAALYQIDRDPLWPALAGHPGSSKPSGTSAATVWATAARAAALAAAATGFPAGPPGSPKAKGLEPGTVITVNPYIQPAMTVTTMKPHKTCPFCFLGAEELETEATTKASGQ